MAALRGTIYLQAFLDAEVKGWCCGKCGKQAAFPLTPGSYSRCDVDRSLLSSCCHLEGSDVVLCRSEWFTLTI